MATTIKLKNGTGAPSAGDLVVAEPALDLTNKRLYTEDSGGTVIEVGTNPGTDVTFADNRKAIFGAGSDLQIYHDGSGSFVDDQGTGGLILRGTNLFLRSSANENYLGAVADGAVTLYHNNLPKLATTSTGIDVTGNATFADNGKAIFGAGSDLQIYHDGSNSYIDENGVGNLFIRSVNGASARIYSGGTASSNLRLLANSGGEITLYHSGSAKLATTSTGIDVTGTVTADGLTVDASTTDMIALNHSTPSNLTTIGQDSSGDFRVRSDSVNKLKSYANGDFELYEDTGTTAKLTWSASNERLVLKTSGAYALDVQASGTSSATMAQFSNSNGSDKAAIRLDASGDGELVLIDAANNEDVVISAGGDSYFNGGRVGIGTSSPAQDFHIREDSGDCNLLIDSANGASQIFFGDDESVNVGKIGYNHASNFMAFNVNTSERMRIDSSGNVNIYGTDNRPLAITSFDTVSTGAGWDLDATSSNGVVTVSTGGTEALRIDSNQNLLVGGTDTFPGDGDTNTGIALTPSGSAAFSRDGFRVVSVNRNTSDGTLIEFNKGGGEVGSIGVDSGDNLYIGGSVANHGGLYFGTRVAAPIDAGTLTDAVMDLGTAGYRFKDLYLSGGVSFDDNPTAVGGSVSSKTLDDYEEGTWTPVASNYEGTMTVNTATYTKVGNLVTARASVSFDATTDASGVSFTGLPFTHTGASKGNGGFIATAASANAASIKMIGSGTASVVQETGGSVTYTVLASSTLEFVLSYETTS